MSSAGPAETPARPTGRLHGAPSRPARRRGRPRSWSPSSGGHLTAPKLAKRTIQALTGTNRYLPARTGTNRAHPGPYGHDGVLRETALPTPPGPVHPRSAGAPRAGGSRGQGLRPRAGADLRTHASPPAPRESERAVPWAARVPSGDPDGTLIEPHALWEAARAARPLYHLRHVLAA